MLTVLLLTGITVLILCFLTTVVEDLLRLRRKAPFPQLGPTDRLQGGKDEESTSEAA